MGSPRVQKLTRVSDSVVMLVNEKNILYVKVNADNANHSDIVYLINGLRKTSEVFDKTQGLVLHGSENLISVTIDGVTNLINANRIEFTGDASGVAKIRYNDGKSKLTDITLGETVQQVKDKIDALISLASSVS